MAWIESHQTLREHPKTKRLCRLLTLDRWQAVGLLQFLWWWALDYAPEGDLSGFSDEDIADAVDWTEDAGRLMRALVEAGFIDDGRHIHDWETFAEKRIARRRANAERMANARAAAKDQPPETRAEHVQRTCSVGVELKTGKKERPEIPERKTGTPPQPLPHSGKGNGAAAPKNQPWNDEGIYGPIVTVEGIKT